MKNLSRKKEIFSFATIFVVAFLMLCFGYSLLLNNNLFDNNININDTSSQIAKNVYANGNQYTLTVLVDDNFESVEINGENIDMQSYTNDYLENQTISVSYELKPTYEFAEYVAYETGNNQNVVAINNNQFTMPSHNVTLEIKRKHNIKVYKVFYENKVSVRESLFENINLDSGNDYDLDFNIDTNYHLFLFNQKYYSSNNNNVSLENTTLSINNAQSDDVIKIYFEKNNFQFRIYCGTNDEANNGVGGRYSLQSSDNIFNPIPVGNNSMVANVYYGQDITLTIVNYTSHLFNRIFVFNQNQMAEGFESITSINANNEITIKNVTSVINIYIQFIETYNVVVETEEVNIAGVMTKIGKSGFELETLSYDNKNRDIVKNGSVSVNTIIDEEYEKVYEFKNWQILDSSNQPIEDISIFAITENDLTSNVLVISNIVQGLHIKAIYGIKNRTVNIAWNGKNGTIESETEHDDYLYTIKYGDDITFVLKPTDDMRFLKSVVLSGNNEIEEENAVQQTQLEDGLEYKISNITENLTLSVEFVVNTWWEHIENFEFTGKGTSKEPYIINNASDLALISYVINNKIDCKQDCVKYDIAYYLVVKNIDCGTDYYFVPIGTIDNPFNGTFDYAFHDIKNITTERDIKLYHYDGLFNIIGPNGRIINRYRNYTTLVLTTTGSVVFLFIVIRIVFAVERRRNKPKRVIILKNYKNLEKDDE